MRLGSDKIVAIITTVHELFRFNGVQQSSVLRPGHFLHSLIITLITPYRITQILSRFITILEILINQTMNHIKVK